MDPATIGTAVVGLTTAASHLQGMVIRFAESAKKEGKSESLTQIIELQTALMEVVEKQQNLISINRELEAKNAELAARAAVQSYYGCYWEQVRGALDGPFSAFMWEEQSKLVRLTFDQFNGRAGKKFAQFMCSRSGDYHCVPVRFLKQRAPKLVQELDDLGHTLPD